MTRVSGIGDRHRQEGDGKITHSLRQHKEYTLDAEHQWAWPYIGRLAFQDEKWQAEEDMWMAEVYTLNDSTTGDKIIANHQKEIEEDNENPGTPGLYPPEMPLAVIENSTDQSNDHEP